MAVVSQPKIELLTPNGPEYREVSPAPPRPASRSEIPIIDLSTIDGSPEERASLAAAIRDAAEGTGFFYVQNHGIPPEVISNALASAKAFFEQSLEEKLKVSPGKGQFSSGFKQAYATQINRSESQDAKETFSWRYHPKYDPAHDDYEKSIRLSNPTIRGEDFMWEGTSHLPGFKHHSITYWQRCLCLARKLIRIFALALQLPEDYFDSVTTFPGADGVFIHYPGTAKDSPKDPKDVGLGSHTDIQCLTLLWQDMSGGLQILSSSGEWLEATPIMGTLVVNIGDFLQRLSNNRFRSTVHRVYNHKEAPRYSMPFFFGFNYDSVCSVVPTCIDKEHPALYEPISCGKWCEDRFALASDPQGKP